MLTFADTAQAQPFNLTDVLTGDVPKLADLFLRLALKVSHINAKPLLLIVQTVNGFMYGIRHIFVIYGFFGFFYAVSLIRYGIAQYRAIIVRNGLFKAQRAFYRVSLLRFCTHVASVRKGRFQRHCKK